MVYDTTDRDSFQHVDSWLQEVNKYASETTVKVLVGNKSDKESERVVTTEEGMKKAEALNLSFIETSAKGATHIEEAFTLISRQLVRIREQSAAATVAAQSAGTSGLQLNAARTAAVNKLNACCAG